MPVNVKDIEEAVNRTGYPLELYVTNEIRKNYHVMNNQYYFDNDEKKARSVDILVPSIEVFIGGDIEYLSIDIVIECKKSDNKAWVFFPMKHFVQSQYSGQILDHRQIISRDYDKHCILWNYEKKLSLHYGKELTDTISPHNDISRNFAVVKIGKTQNTGNKQEKVKDEIFEGISQVLKFISYDIDRRQAIIRDRYKKGKRNPVIILYYPVIIFEGNMYRGHLVNHKIRLSEVEHVILEYEYQPSYTNQTKTFYIDFLKKDYLDEYLKIIETECRMLKKLVKYNNKNLKNSVNNLRVNATEK